MRIILIILCLYILNSCHSEKDDYKILNDFLRANKTVLENLSAEPYYLKDASKKFGDEDLYEIYGFPVQEEKKYKIDTAQIQSKINIPESGCLTKISKPYLSTDKKKIFIIIEKNCKLSQELFVHLLFLKNDKWVIKTHLKYSVVSSH